MSTNTEHPSDPCGSNGTPGQGHEKSMRSVLVYSPDIDFCICLSMLLQDRYMVSTATDPEMLVLVAKACHPDVIIVDSLPTVGMLRRFEAMKLADSHVRIVLFSAHRFEDERVPKEVRRYVDMVFHKPVDLGEFTAYLAGAGSES